MQIAGYANYLSNQFQYTDISKQDHQNSTHRAFISPYAQVIEDLKSEYPDDRFEVTAGTSMEAFNCLDCERKFPAWTVSKMKEHLDSGGHKYRVACRQGKFKRVKKEKRSRSYSGRV